MVQTQTVLPTLLIVIAVCVKALLRGWNVTVTPTVPAGIPIVVVLIQMVARPHLRGRFVIVTQIVPATILIALPLGAAQV